MNTLLDYFLNLKGSSSTIDWCIFIHVCDKNEVEVDELWSPEMTDLEFEKYSSYQLFLPKSGQLNKYHLYVKPPLEESDED